MRRRLQIERVLVVAAYGYLDGDFDNGAALDNLDIRGPLVGIKFLI